VNGNVFDARPVFLDAGGYCGEHFDRTAFDARMRFPAIALKQGQKKNGSSKAVWIFSCRFF